jgi:ribosomal protein L37AE/L43A
VRRTPRTDTHGETADYSCPECGHSTLPRDNTPMPRFRCERCGNVVHEAVARNVDLLERLSERDDVAGDLARQLLETGGVAS